MHLNPCPPGGIWINTCLSLRRETFPAPKQIGAWETFPWVSGMLLQRIESHFNWQYKDWRSLTKLKGRKWEATEKEGTILCLFLSVFSPLHPQHHHLVYWKCEKEKKKCHFRKATGGLHCLPVRKQRGRSAGLSLFLQLWLLRMLQSFKSLLENL